eukprot:gene37502-biopygen24804
MAWLAGLYLIHSIAELCISPVGLSMITKLSIARIVGLMMGLNLSYTTVRAPIAGRASRANITAGNLVNEQVVLTSIAGVSRVHAYFDGSEQTFLRLRKGDPGQ